MPRITPNLWFDTQGHEAAELYVSLFPNSRITHVSYYGEHTPGTAGTVMTVQFELDGQEFTAINGGPLFTFSEAVSFHIACADQAEVDHYWSRLGEGGEEGQCGWLKDRYGVSWQVVPAALGELLGDPIAHVHSGRCRRCSACGSSMSRRCTRPRTRAETGRIRSTRSRCLRSRVSGKAGRVPTMLSLRRRPGRPHGGRPSRELRGPGP